MAFLCFAFLIAQLLALSMMSFAVLLGDKQWSAYNVVMVGIGLTAMFYLERISARLSSSDTSLKIPDDGRRRAP